MTPTLVAGDEPFTLCVAALSLARAGHACVLRRTIAPPGASGLLPWPTALIDDPGFRRFLSAELSLGWPGGTVADLDDSVGLEARFASALRTARSRLVLLPDTLVPVRRGATGTYDLRTRAAGEATPPSPWSSMLDGLPAADVAQGGVMGVSCLVLTGFAGDMVDEGWWSPHDPHLFGAMRGRAPRATRRGDIEAAVADVRSLCVALPAWLGAKKTSTPRGNALDGISGLRRSGA